MTDLTPGDKFLLPVEITFPANKFRHAYAKNPSGCEVPIYLDDIPHLIPADRITELESDLTKVDMGVERLRKALRDILYLRPGGPCHNKIILEMENIAIAALED
jgi:hypothetical protein